MPSTSVELLRASRKRVFPAPPAPVPTASSGVPAVPAPVPAVASATTVTAPGAGAPASPPAVEIALPNGRIVRVPPGFAPAELERVLAIASGDEPPQPPPVPT